MSDWVAPGPGHLKEFIESSSGHLLLCSPYISTPALDIVAESLPPNVDRVEVWTRLETRDWLTGVSDPEGLLDFMRQVEAQVGPVPLRQATRLHAKIFISDGPLAIAGSANLTRGGFGGNLEVARVVADQEIDELRAVVDQLRPSLSVVTQQQFEEFVALCVEKLDSQEALLEIVRDELPQPDFAPPPLASYAEFLAALASNQAAQAGEVLTIARNWDGNNNNGKVKQAFFGIQRFLQEYPLHRAFVEGLPDDKWFDVGNSPLKGDWFQFLSDHADEVNDAYAYSIPTLLRYLTPTSGGQRLGGGGGDNELKRVWPFVPALMKA